MKTLAVLSRKGGVGKSTLALHLAVAAVQSGLRTMVVDTDPQRSVLDWGRARGDAQPSVIESKPSALFTAQLNAARVGVELMIIDGCPHGDDDSAAAARCADLSLIVLRPGFFDVRAVMSTAQVVKNVGARGLFVINQAPPRRNGREPKILDETLVGLRAAGLPVAGIGLRARAAYQRGLSGGRAAQEVEPHGLAAKEINALWRKVAAELVAPAPAGLDQARRFSVTAVESPRTAVAPGP